MTILAGYPGDGPQCCHKHRDEWMETTPNIPWYQLRSVFLVCNDCGNKRCPKATDCSLDCTNSNEPGQEGSVYA